MDTFRRVPVYEKTIEVYAGDLFEQPFIINTAASYTDWKSQWRGSLSDPKPIDLTVTVADDTTIVVTATPEQTRLMQGGGSFDLQAMPGPRTFIVVETSGAGDYTR